jgi:hypothetical protein
MSAPLISKSVAKECLNVWGVASMGKPALFAYLATILWMVLAVSRIPSPLFRMSTLPLWRIKRGLKLSWRDLK